MSHPSVPDSLNERFEIHEALEPGSTGPRFRATDKSSGRKGVLVIVEANALPSSTDRQRVRRELAKQATLSHPHLALPVVTGEDGKILYYLRDDVPGTTLRTRLSSGALQPSEALAVATQVAAGLDELHRAGLLFRDLKPERIVLQDGGHVVLLEAGLAAPIENDEAMGLQGTAPYVSPEQAKGRLQSFRSDLYALGIVLHEMVEGNPPHTGELEDVLKAHRDGNPPNAPSALPEPAKELHQQLLSREPRKRPFSAQQVRQMLNPFLPPELQSSTPSASPSAPSKATMLGMPAVAPARPPSMQPARPPSMQPARPPSMAPEPEPEPPVEQSAERKPGTTPRNPDATQQVALSDIIEEQSIPKSAPPKRAPTSVPPPPPSGETALEEGKPSVETTQPVDAVDILDEEVAPAPAVAAPELGGADDAGAYPAVAAAEEPTSDAFPVDPVPAPEGPVMDDLDYDDLAETVARESPAGLGSMSPAIGKSGDGFASGSPSAAPLGGFPVSQEPATVSSGGGVSFAAPSSSGAQAAPSSSGGYAGQPQGYTEPVHAQPAGGSKGGVLFLAGGALIFLAVALFVVYQVVSKGEEQPVAMLPSAAPATSPTPAVAPTTPAEPKPPEAEATEPGTDESAAEEEAAAQAAEVAAAEEAAAAEAAAAEAAAAEAAAEAEAAAAAAAEAEAAESTMAAATTRRRSGASEMRSTSTAMASMASMAGGGSAFDQAREQAREAFQARNYSLAAQLYQRATAMNPRHAGSWSGLGAAQMQMRNYQGAVQAYQRAVTLSPRSSGFFTALGHAYRAQGNSNAARQAYQRAVALNPNNRSAQQALQAL